MRVYLDSSAIVKRYVEETGSESVDVLYNALEKNDEPDHALTFSAWNVGEVFGVIDTLFHRGDIKKDSMTEALYLFSGETKKFVTMRKINILPAGSKVLASSWDLILKYHIYQADALQLVTARRAGCDLFVSADKKLLDCAKLERLFSANPDRDYDLIQDAVALKRKNIAEKSGI
ncbi:MAG: type II toxin-antitoxin system VapC family toxin [Nitrososphaerales archaeon]